MWNKRWLVLRRGSTPTSARLEKYETEAASLGTQGSSHCVFYELRRAQVINRTDDRPGVYVIMDDSTSLQIATDSST